MQAQRAEQAVKAAAPVVVTLIVCLVVTLAFWRLEWRGLYLMEALDVAQVARHVSEGDGLATSFVRPVGLQFDDRLPGHRDLYHGPLYPLALALVFGAMPATDRTVGLASLAFFMLTLPAVYVLARRLFSRPVALLSVICYGVNGTVLGFAVSGLHVSALVLLFTAALCLVGEPTRRGRAAGAVVGVLLGLCCLTEWWALVLAATVVVVLWRGGPEARRSALVCVVVVVLVVAPWVVRNWAITGRPLFSLRCYWGAAFTDTFPGLSVFRETAPRSAGPVAFALAHPAQMARKWLLGLGALYSSLPPTAGLYVLPFFLVGLFLPMDGERQRLVRGRVLLGLGLVLVTTPLHNPQSHFLLPLLPAVTALGVACYWRLVRGEERGPLGRFLLGAGFAALAAYPLFVQLALTPRATPRGVGQALRYIEEHLPPEAVVMTDVPWEVAWHSGRTAVWLTSARAGVEDPTETEDFRRVDGEEGRVGAIFLSAGLPTYPATERVGGWQGLQRPPGDFEPAAVFLREDGATEILLVRPEFATQPEAAGGGGA